VIKIDVILNVIGIAFIILSITIIISSSKKEQRMFEEISSMYDEVKYYYNSLGKAMISFDDLIEKSIDKIEKKQNVTTINNDEKHQDEKNEISFIPKTIYTPYKTAELKENKHLVYEKILKLKKMGLSNIEIAQKLEIGIREVEIILRMMEKV
jgi:hypothetical protein